MSRTELDGDPLLAPSSARIKAVAALRDRRARDAQSMTLIDGAREARRALDAGIDVVEAIVCEPLLAGSDAAAALDVLRRRAIPIHRASETAFAKVAFGDRAEGIVLVGRLPAGRLEDLHLPASPLLLVVEGVEKPGNLGAILRTADGAAVDAVIAASPRTDLANPNVIRASAGTIFSMPMAAAPSSRVLDFLVDHAIRPLATRAAARRSYTRATLTGSVAIIVGAEDRGLGDVWSGDGIEDISIPMNGVADSLNVSVSAGVVLYEARRQRDGAH